MENACKQAFAELLKRQQDQQLIVSPGVYLLLHARPRQAIMLRRT